MLKFKKIRIWEQLKSLKSESWGWVWCSNKLTLQRGQRTFTISEESKSEKWKVKHKNVDEVCGWMWMNVDDAWIFDESESETNQNTKVKSIK